MPKIINMETGEENTLIPKKEIVQLQAENQQQAEQIEGLEKIIEVRDMQVNELQAENARLKELILQGEDFIEEEWQTVRSFGVLRAKQWYGAMMDEIAKIKAAPPQKGE